MHSKIVLLLLSSLPLIKSETLSVNNITMENNTLTNKSVINTETGNINVSCVNTDLTSNDTCNPDNYKVANDSFSSLFDNVYIQICNICNSLLSYTNYTHTIIFLVGYSFVLTIYVIYLKNKHEDQSLRDFMTSNLYKIPMSTMHGKRETVNKIITV